MDTAMPQSTGMIKDNIAKLGFKVADIKIILNTHAHLDHTGGFAEIKKETGAQLIAKAKAMKIDVLLGPHPEVYGMQAKRAEMKEGAPNPFVKPGEIVTYATGLSDDFDKQLTKQTAALEKK
jgi:glyoxylase-like metal-dependent hydrolase (beta-lactamase superfamily II)